MDALTTPTNMNDNMPRRRKKGLVERIFNKNDDSEIDSATDHLLSTSKTKSDRFSMSFFGRNPSYRLLSSASDGHHVVDKQMTRDTSFTISAVHSVRSQQNLEGFIKTGLNAIADASGYGKSEKKSPPSSPYHPVGSSTAKPRQAYEIEAIDAQLQRMFKLQLGPLTIGRDIAPVLDMWRRLQDARVGYGRKAIANTWSDLARATAIVAKKMTIQQIVEVIDTQCRLMYPCPRSLRLPADMLMALADRTGAGGALAQATDNDVLLYCASVSRLMDAATVIRTGPASAPVSSEQWLRALSRAATITPLVEAGMREAARRGKIAVKAVNNKSSELQSQSIVTEALIVSGILAELAGTRLAAPAYCLNQAALAASAEINTEQIAESETCWWKKVGKAPQKLGRKSGENGSTKATIGLLLPSHTDMGAQESSRLAGEAAKCLERFILPASISLMNPKELSNLAVNLKDATADDAGAPYHEPLRQALGRVVEEAVERTSISTTSESMISRSCVREVMAACRARLLHVKFPLAHTKIGIAESLSKLESWKGQMKAFCKAARANKAIEREIHLSKLEDEKEAMSLELDASFSGFGEEGEEEVVSTLRVL